MTVRWKPLLVLSGLFLIVAAVGVVAITLTLVPQSSQAKLKLARAARNSGGFAEAEIYYLQALQLDGRNAATHEEFATLYQDWAKQASAEKKAEYRLKTLEYWRKSLEFDKSAKGPRRRLLEDAMVRDIPQDSVYWAKELLNVDPDNLDAHFVLASEALEYRSPNVPEITRHQKVLEAGGSSPIRKAWISAKLADISRDPLARAKAFSQSRAITLDAKANAVDRMTQLRLSAMEIRTENDVTRLGDEVGRLLTQLKALGAPEDLAPTKVARLRTLLEQTQRALAVMASKSTADGRQRLDGMVDKIEIDLEVIFQQVLTKNQDPDLQTELSYADHLRFRKQPKRCLELIETALQSPRAGRKTASFAVMGLHTVAAEMILGQADDPTRFDKAMPHVKAMVACPEPRFQGLGHLFAGTIELDQSGLARAMTTNEPVPDASANPARPLLRVSALEHLKQAAILLPDTAEAQARYGVALVLADEQNLGRQYLQNALRLDSLDEQYQVWAAWTILQAGYPEEALPIVEALQRQIDSGLLPRDQLATLHLLRGEIYQAKRRPEDLERALHEYELANSGGRAGSADVRLRQAQIEVQLGHADRALVRLEALRSDGQGGPSAEHQVVITLESQGKTKQARDTVKAARAKYPLSGELVGVEASLMVKDGKPLDADRLLEQFERQHPGDVSLAQLRAQILVEKLANPDKAREILLKAASQSGQSAPLLQLAGMELDGNRLDAAAQVIAKIRDRWKDSAAGDVLAAQLAVKRDHVSEATDLLESALKKDPENKMVRLLKARLDGKTGAIAEATRSLESLVRDKPMKEVEAGTSLMSAAQSALANLSLQKGELDDAIHRFEELKRGDQDGSLSRQDRWQLITAYVSKGQWSVARREIAAILNDVKQPPTNEERVRGSNLYRQQGENGPALAQLEYVLKVNPSQPEAVVTRSYLYLSDRQYKKAAEQLERGIELSDKNAVADKRSEGAPAVFYLMLAAVENETPPSTNALARAIAVLDKGLSKRPDSYELVDAKYLAMLAANDPAGALAFIAAKAKTFPLGPFRRLLVEKYRDQRQYAKAEELLRDLRKESPDDANLAAALVQIVSLESAEAGMQNQPDRERSLNEKAVGMLKEYRAKFPKEISFLRAECDMTARQGDFSKALALTREVDKLNPFSNLGPILRARLYSVMGKTREVAEAYEEALKRTPRNLDLHVALAQTYLKLGRGEDALRQSKLVLEMDKDRKDAILIEAQALAEVPDGAAGGAARREKAVERLRIVIASNPSIVQAYHLLASVYAKGKDPKSAVIVLEDCLKANPDDTSGATQLIQLLTDRATADAATRAVDLATAQRIATEILSKDKKGALVLGVAVGFYRSGQLKLAYPYAESAAKTVNSPAAHLNFGDLLLSIAEGESARQERNDTLARAVAEYDLVLKQLPASVEAVNNKAWILHSHLGKSSEALDLVLACQRRVPPALLPGEFYDTLGAIQETVGQTRSAEQSYLDGLKKAPEHAMLNYHMGKLISTDASRKLKAKTHLSKALAGSDRLSVGVAQEAKLLVQQIDRGTQSR